MAPSTVPLLAEIVLKRLVCFPVELLFADLVESLGHIPKGLGRDFDGICTLFSSVLNPVFKPCEGFLLRRVEFLWRGPARNGDGFRWWL